MCHPFKRCAQKHDNGAKLITRFFLQPWVNNCDIRRMLMRLETASFPALWEENVPLEMQTSPREMAPISTSPHYALRARVPHIKAVHCAKHTYSLAVGGGTLCLDRFMGFSVAFLLFFFFLSVCMCARPRRPEVTLGYCPVSFETMLDPI